MNSQYFFNDELLDKRVNTFYGYGNYEGNYWFVGMEEAGRDFNDIEKRINIWSDRGKQEIEDVAEYHIAIEAWDRRIQNTWKGLIRIVLSAKGTENIHIEEVRNYQIEELGRKDKETCLLELLPLPSPSIKVWIYSQHSRLSYLCDRPTYEKYCLDNRINYINKRIKENRPKAVVFYGIGFEYFYRKIADVDFLPISGGFFIGRNSETVFVIAKHPVSKGLKNEYFYNIGKSIAAKLA